MKPRPPRRAGRSPALTVVVVSAVLAPVLAGCALQPPQPWEKGHLARPEMTMDTDPLERRLSQHIYASKENSSGGHGVGGGGCGCN